VEVGKRARTETGIARGTTSVSQAVVQLAGRHVALDQSRVLILGTGEMGEGMAVALAGAGVGELVIANRTAGRADNLAARVGGRAVPIDSLADTIASVDVLLTSTGAEEPLLTTAEIGSRAAKPLLILDVAVPRDVEPAVRELAGVTVLDLDDLRRFTRPGLENRRREVSKVQSIIAEEVESYLGDALARQAAPTVAALHDRAEEIRLAELERFRNRLSDLDPRQRQAVEALTKGLVAKLLHEPTVRLKDATGTPRGERLGDALRALFGLD
jgi:glutamyl-tRNA reductase